MWFQIVAQNFSFNLVCHTRRWCNCEQSRVISAERQNSSIGALLTASNMYNCNLYINGCTLIPYCFANLITQDPYNMHVY